MKKWNLYLMAVLIITGIILSGCSKNSTSSSSTYEQTTSVVSDDDELEVIPGIDVNQSDEEVNRQLEEKIQEDIEQNGLVEDKK